MTPVAFSEFKNLFEGRVGTIMGKGPTDYDKGKDGFPSLALEEGPIFLINDACQHAPQGKDCFHFMLDKSQVETWTAVAMPNLVQVIPDEYKAIVETSPNNICLYRKMHSKDHLLIASRDELADTPRLSVSFGTISPILHFCWFAGIRKVRGIAVDGINSQRIIQALCNGGDYDARIKVDYEKVRPCLWQNGLIRAQQDRIAGLLGLEMEYLGTPQLPPLPPTKWVTGYTPNYEPYVKDLLASAAKFGVEVYAERWPPVKDWLQGQAMKPAFMQKMLKCFEPHPVCWIDADAVFAGEPVAITSLPPDVDVAHCTRTRTGEVLSGLVWLSGLEGSQELVRKWVENQRKTPGDWDQKTLADAIVSTKINACALPPEYCGTDWQGEEHPGIVPVIEQRQASRTMRKEQ